MPYTSLSVLLSPGFNAPSLDYAKSDNFNVFTDQEAADNGLTEVSEQVDAGFIQKTYNVSFDIGKNEVDGETISTITGDDEQKVFFDEKASAGAIVSIKSPASGEYSFAGWEYKYTVKGTAVKGTIADYADLQIKADTVFTPLYAKGVNVKASSINGYVKAAETEEAVGTDI